MTESFCTEQKKAFGDTNYYDVHGGMTSMSNAMKAGMVLVLSLWDDYYSDMLWLDSTYPTTGNPATPGIARGSCATTSGVPATVEADSPGAYVIYSNIKVGTLNSTFTGTSTGTGGSTTTSSSAKSASSTASSGGGGGTVAHWGQCGGIGYTGPTTCVSPYKCTVGNPYYSQCL